MNVEFSKKEENIDQNYLNILTFHATRIQFVPRVPFGSIFTWNFPKFRLLSWQNWKFWISHILLRYEWELWNQEIEFQIF